MSAISNDHRSKVFAFRWPLTWIAHARTSRVKTFFSRRLFLLRSVIFPIFVFVARGARNLNTCANNSVSFDQTFPSCLFCPRVRLCSVCQHPRQPFSYFLKYADKLKRQKNGDIALAGFEPTILVLDMVRSWAIFQFGDMAKCFIEYCVFGTKGIMIYFCVWWQSN